MLYIAYTPEQAAQLLSASTTDVVCTTNFNARVSAHPRLGYQTHQGKCITTLLSNNTKPSNSPTPSKIRLVPPSTDSTCMAPSSFQHLANHCSKLMPQTCPHGGKAVTADTQRCSGWHACQGVTVLMHLVGCRAARARTWMRRSSHTGRPSSSWTMLSARGGRHLLPPSRVSACCSLVLTSQCAAASKNCR